MAAWFTPEDATSVIYPVVVLAPEMRGVVVAMVSLPWEGLCTELGPGSALLRRALARTPAIGRCRRTWQETPVIGILLGILLGKGKLVLNLPVPPNASASIYGRPHRPRGTVWRPMGVPEARQGDCGRHTCAQPMHRSRIRCGAA